MYEKIASLGYEIFNYSVDNQMAIYKSEGSGTLNPMWVEWLMGYPIGWTDLKD